MKYLIPIALMLSACTSRYDAQVTQANAKAVEAQAAIVQAQEQAKMYQTLADAAKPTYWPLVVLFVLAFVSVLLIVRWYMMTVTAVATGQPSQMVLLPGDPGFNRALRLAAQERGARAVKRNGQYYIVDGQTAQEVRRLTVMEDR